MLGDPTRLRILEILQGDERSVADLAAATGTPRSRLSNHLACLKWCGFLAARRRGRHVLYRVSDARVRAMLALTKSLAGERCEHLAGCRRIGPEWI